MSLSSITIISSPYHVGLRDHRVGDGPNRIRSLGVVQRLEQLGIVVNVHEIQTVDEFEGEIGRSFEVLRRTSSAVTQARAANSFPLVLSGNCMASVGVAAGLGIKDLGFVYFDAHDDMDTPSTNTNGYFDAMGLSMLAGKSWHNLIATVPGFQPLNYDRFIYCGLRDISESQMQTVDYPGELSKSLDSRSYSPALCHLDLDVLDETVGKVNGYESAGGLFEDELVECMKIVARKVQPVSLTVCSFNHNLGDGDKIAEIGVKAILAFVKSLLGTQSSKEENHL